MRFTSVALRCALAVAACGCAPRPALSLATSDGGTPGGEHALLASIERTGCFGWCPIYTLTIFRDGIVAYEGEAYVKAKGKVTGHLAPEQIRALDELFQRNRYVDLRDAYTEYETTDLPSVNTSYAARGKTKSISHYLGDSHAPRALTEIEDGIERIVGVEQWIGTEKERKDLSGFGP